MPEADQADVAYEANRAAWCASEIAKQGWWSAAIGDAEAFKVPYACTLAS